MDVFPSPECLPTSQMKSEDSINMIFENSGLKEPDAVLHHKRKICGNCTFPSAEIYGFANTGHTT